MNWQSLIPIIAVVIVPLIANIARYLKQQAEVRQREQLQDQARRDALRRGKPTDQSAPTPTPIQTPAPKPAPVSTEAARREELAAVVARRRAQLAQASASATKARPPTRPPAGPPWRTKPNPFVAPPAGTQRPQAQRQQAQNQQAQRRAADPRKPAHRPQPVKPQQTSRPTQRTAFRPATRQSPPARPQAFDHEQETSARVVEDAATLSARGRASDPVVTGRAATHAFRAGFSIRSMLIAHEVFSPPVSLRVDRSRTTNPFDPLGY